ncbi:O-antigen ligase [Knoellia sp. p5-6-4]|uniref:O-antigen ligase family protein n=1 Tax=unclassified Knoellia TaxID=2618719 RepID=UPI0023DAB3C0|nr:O-antigen ligase family protein [Knoellia sp. p5-6-4]MDF2146903.1 O-antigen ligase family protein [Knoellia sp. p5-6-4]
MTSVLTPQAPHAPRHARPRPVRTWLALAVVGAAACAAAVISGLAFGGSGDKRMVVIPLAAAIGVALAALAFTRYAAFVLMLLAVRASLDLVKLSGVSAGNTDTNTATARGLDPASMLSMLFIVASVFWLLAQYSSGRQLRGSPLRTAFIVFVVAGAVSVIGANPWEAAFLEVARILSVVMMFVVLEQLITNRETMMKVLYAAYASVLFPLAYTLFGLAIGDPASEAKGSFTRLTGPFAQSNTFARYLAFLIVFGVAVFPVLRKKQKLVMLPILGLSTAFLLLTLTRSAIIAAVLAVVIIALVQRRTSLLVGFAASALLAAALVPGLTARFATLTAEEQVVGRPETGNSLQWRYDYWTKVIPLANENPVTGIGLNMTQYQTSAKKQPHSDFIRAYVETGLFGLLAYVAMHFLLLRNAILAVQRTARGTLEHGVAAGALGVAVCFLVASLGSNMMSNVVSLWYLVAFSAAGAYVARTNAPGPGGRWNLPQ